MGLLTLAEVGQEEAIRAMVSAEQTIGPTNLTLSTFRGWENLVPPDMLEIIPDTQPHLQFVCLTLLCRLSVFCITIHVVVCSSCVDAIS